MGREWFRFGIPKLKLSKLLPGLNGRHKAVSLLQSPNSKARNEKGNFKTYAGKRMNGQFIPVPRFDL